MLLVIGLIVGILIGGTLGYLLFNGRTVSITTPQATPSASASPSATPSATATATATAPPATATPAAQGVVPCPPEPAIGAHTLGSPAPPSGGRHESPSLDFCGRGSTTIPTGTTRFTTGNNWELGIAHSCPAGAAGQSGMGTTLTINEIRPDGSQGPDTVTQPGDWSDSGGQLMATGGNYQLKVTAVLPDCVWKINVYTP